MIEMRIVEHELGVRPEIQYRFVIFTANVTGALCPPDGENFWSPWQTAPYVKAEGGNVDD
jgi:hypothetical protein